MGRRKDPTGWTRTWTGAKEKARLAASREQGVRVGKARESGYNKAVEAREKKDKPAGGKEREGSTKTPREGATELREDDRRSEGRSGSLGYSQVPIYQNPRGKAQARNIESKEE